MSDVDYGRDLSCVGDLTLSMDECGTGVAGPLGGVTIVAQAVARRLMTPRGSLADDEDYGDDLRELVGGTIDLRFGLGQITARAQREILKEQRVSACTVAGNYDATAKILTLNILLVAAGVGPFTLTLAISAVSVTILSAGSNG